MCGSIYVYACMYVDMCIAMCKYMHMPLGMFSSYATGVRHMEGNYFTVWTTGCRLCDNYSSLTD